METRVVEMSDDKQLDEMDDSATLFTSGLGGGESGRCNEGIIEQKTKELPKKTPPWGKINNRKYLAKGVRQGKAIGR